MMSILIKDMEMPKSCSDCPCIDLDNDEYECAVCGISKKLIPWKWANTQGIDVIYLRPTDCPLVEVPTPHGRLIDADALMKLLVCNENTINVFWFEDIVNQRPSIIDREDTV